jgi:hypothetical protein
LIDAYSINPESPVRFERFNEAYAASEFQILKRTVEVLRDLEIMTAKRYLGLVFR